MLRRAKGLKLLWPRFQDLNGWLDPTEVIENDDELKLNFMMPNSIVSQKSKLDEGIREQCDSALSRFNQYLI